MKKTSSFFRARSRKWLAVLMTLAVLGGCAMTPDTITHDIPAKPKVAPVAPASNGAIFQSGSFRPMYEDRRAMYVGDTITIVINEKTSAAKQGAGSASHTGSASNSMLQVFNIANRDLEKLGVSTSTANKFEDKGATSSSNNFTGTISAVVADVLPNGNLLVKGEKQIAMDRGTEFIRISGIVDPKNITSGNLISSSLVADARVEYRSNMRLDMADLMSILARFFLSVSPI
ncbi:MAG: flagellar basal body L-ring protein FlgH [Oxalobacter sp.]|nr:MAG: flagellar basal body L-ring protein FlgH [Oxalobacter sp.]